MSQNRINRNQNTSKIQIALAQINPTVGDLHGNTQKILTRIQEASEQNADLVVFPEMALCGYPVWDLANKKEFVRQTRESLLKIAKQTRNLSLASVVGFIDHNQTGRQRNHNAAAWIQEGKIRGIYHKRLLPTYDVFLEDIFFESGQKPLVIPYRGIKFGLSICEDMWDDDYSEKPIRELVKRGAQCIINISASPYYAGALERRQKTARARVRECRCPILYVNQTGAQDDLIFDGQSFLMNAKGQVVYQAPAFTESLQVVSYPALTPVTSKGIKLTMSSPQEMYHALKLGIQDYCAKNGFKKTLLGLSGGIDSALVAALAADAIGPQSVKAFAMPSPFSSEGSWKDAEDLAARLGIEFHIHPISIHYETLKKTFHHYQRTENRENVGEKISLAMENLQARLRGLELMYFSNHEGRLLLSTGNKSELAVGYCTLYGDMCGGLAVLGDVYKTEVYALCRYRNSLAPVIPQSILDKAPSAELRPDQKDQDSLPPYDILDAILKAYIEENLSGNDLIRHLRKKNISSSVIRDVLRKVDHNEYKRKQTPPILRVTEKAWFGRRMPITNHFSVTQ